MDAQGAAGARGGARRVRPRLGRRAAAARSVGGSARTGHARRRRRDRCSGCGLSSRRVRDHERRPPRSAAGAVLPCRSRARRPGERPRNRRRARGDQGAAQPDPRPRLRQLDGGLQRRRSLSRSRDRRHRAVDALRRLQARKRGNGSRLLERRRRRVDRDPAVRRLRTGPRPGAHVRPVARDGGRGTWRRLHDRVRRDGAVRLRA